MGRIYKRNDDGPYWGDWTDPNGKRQQRSLRTKDRRVATERLRGHELAATPQARGRKQRLSEAIGYMISTLHDKAEGTRDMYRKKGRRIAKTFGDPFVHEITRDTLSEYIARRLNETDTEHGDASPHTVQKELITIRRALREAHERGILPVLPAMPRHSPRYKPREVWLTPPQFEQVCAELEPQRRLWASLAALAGGSAGEVERCDWAKVDLDRGKLFLPGTKRETRARWVGIAPALLSKLLEVPEAERMGPIAGTWGNVRRDLHAAVARANAKQPTGAPQIPKVSPNDLRRTFASWLVQNGVPLLTVATLMGHSSTRMVEKVYGKLSKANFDEAIAALPLLGSVTPVSLSGARLALLPPTPVQVGGGGKK